MKKHSPPVFNKRAGKFSKGGATAISRENKLGQDFDSLAKRILYSYIAAYPTFIPVDSMDADHEAQRQMYDFTYHFLRTVYDAPDILGIPQIADGYFEDWEQNNSNPQLIEDMTRIEAKFFDFCEVLFKLGKLGTADGTALRVMKSDLMIPKVSRDRLEKIGISVTETKECAILEIPSYPLAFPAWKLLSAAVDAFDGRKTQRMLAFVFGRYEGKTYKAEHYFGDVSCSAGAIGRLETCLDSDGYRRINDEPVGLSTRFAWVKWEKEYPKKETAEFCAHYDWRKKNPLVFSFRIPYFRRLLKESYPALNDELKELIFDRTKDCTRCEFCTQTDKTGNRPCSAMDLCYDGKTLSKCPVFPNLAWHSIDDTLVYNIVALLTLAKELA